MIAILLVAVLIVFAIIWFSTRKPSAERPAGQSLKTEFSFSTTDMIRIKNPDFFGWYSQSKSGNFVLAWSPIGDRHSGNFLIFESGVLKAQGNLANPMDGKISNNGNFVLNDWMDAEKLQGTFYAFDSEGKILLRKQFEANLDNGDISEDGAFAACHTCNSANEDSNKVTIFDLRSKTIVAAFSPPFWPRSYSFDVNHRILSMEFEEKKYKFAFDGTFLDQPAWERAWLESANGYMLLDLVQEKLKEKTGTNLEDYSEIVELLTRAVKDEISDFAKAKAFRIRGEIYERCGLGKNALTDFVAATKIYPKIGLKRKIDLLNKKPLKRL